MEEFQFEIDNDNIIHLTKVEDFPKHKALLYIFHANKIPPHIGWSENNAFYSLKATGADIGLDTKKINHIILKKQIPTLIVELSGLEITNNNTNDIFSKYGTALEKGKTCLNPIDEVLFDQVKHEKVGDLLQSLFDKKMNIIYYGVNLPRSFRGISNYSRVDIEKRIIDLQ